MPLKICPFIKKLKNVEVTEKTAVFRIVWKIPRKSRLETRIKSTKNKGEGRNEFPEVKGTDTSWRCIPSVGPRCRNEFPDVKGIDTISAVNLENSPGLV